MHLTPIGSIHSPVTETVDEKWGSVVSEIHIDEHLAPGLKGLDQFSHVLVVFFMHRATFNPETDLVRHHRGRSDLPKTGVFAQRAKHRPNPIGITAVELLGVEGNVVRVRGLDAVHETPVLDIKPYFPAFDRIESPRVPDYVRTLMADYF